MKIIDAEAADRSVSGLLVEVGGLDLRHFTPRSELGRGDVCPVFSAVASDPDPAIVGSRPKRVHRFVGRCEGINHAAQLGDCWIGGKQGAYAGRGSGIRTSEIAADGLPGVSAVDCLEENVGGVV